MASGDRHYNNYTLVSQVCYPPVDAGEPALTLAKSGVMLRSPGEMFLLGVAALEEVALPAARTSWRF